MPGTAPQLTTQRDTGARFLLVGAAVVVVVAGLKAASDLILPFLISGFLALISLPLLNWLQTRRVPKGLAVPITFLATLSVLAGVIVLIGGSLARFTEQVPRYKASLQVMLDGITARLDGLGLSMESPFVTDLFDPGKALDMVSRTLLTLTSVLSNVVLVILTIAFILFEAAGFPAKIEAAFGRKESSARYDKVRREVQHYMGIKTMVSLATGIVVGLSLALLGIDFAFLWGTLAFLLNYIPSLGSILAAVPPTLLAAVQFGPGKAVAVAVLFAVVNVILGTVLEPYLLGRRLGLSTLVIFLSLVFWGWVWGPLGMLFSVPLTMIVKIMLENTQDLRWLAILLDASPGKAAGTQTQ